MRRVQWLLGLVCVLACNEPADDESTFVCPATVPAHDDPCEQPNATCTYMSCDEFGVGTATCRDDRRWDLAMSACTEVECVQETCAPGFVCVRTVAGFPSGTCVENTCEDGPIGCECPGCGELPCTSYGLTLECNACASDICP